MTNAEMHSVLVDLLNKNFPGYKIQKRDPISAGDLHKKLTSEELLYLWQV